ncbi:HD family hydrolase [Nitrosopumilus sp.]|uniref:HD domain-containing protein n=1 Tax=Nitrosopumilus sp. TaxID=2024843 RepID=UPI00247C6D94|nr:HD domain-containing protein [Nitrosopumilus sp.]MCV0430081.1 HD domain-containing protein [Nitrosopumilus sp.]
MITNFFKTAVNLKDIQRQGWIEKLSIHNPESVADHSYSMAIMGMVLSDMENMNSEKVLKMILLHDLAESIIGDFTPEQIISNVKKELEEKTFLKILDDLPNSLKAQYRDIWNEFQNHNTEESKFVHQIDRLEMALQAKTYQKTQHKDVSVFLKTAENDIIHPKLKELFRKIIKDE